MNYEQRSTGRMTNVQNCPKRAAFSCIVSYIKEEFNTSSFSLGIPRNDLFTKELSCRVITAETHTGGHLDIFIDNRFRTAFGHSTQEVYAGSKHRSHTT